MTNGIKLQRVGPEIQAGVVLLGPGLGPPTSASVGAVDHFLWMPAPQCVTRPLRPPRASPQPVLQLGLPDSLEDEQVVLVTGGAAEKSPSFGLGVLPGGAGPGSGSLALDFVLAKRNL